jgi:hypothetical protein
MSQQAFEIYKLMLAQSRTDWDFRPLATRALDAAEVFEQELEERGGGGSMTQSQQMNSPAPESFRGGVP